jgi:hypothetical protein
MVIEVNACMDGYHKWNSEESDARLDALHE